MKIAFANPRLQALLSDDKRLTRRYGPDTAQQVRKRMAQIRRAEDLEHLGQTPGRCHELTRDRAGAFAFDLPNGRRLVFEPTPPIPRTPDGGIDRRRVAGVTLLEIANYHRG